MNLGIVIRNYRTEDKDSVQHLIQLNTPKYFAPEEEKDLIYYLEHEIDQYFIIELNGEIVGSGGINFKSEGEKQIGVISWDLIHPKYQRIGIGRKFIEHRLLLLKTKKQCEFIIVRTSQFVFRFYEKLGFELIEIIEDYWSKGFDLYLMKYLIN